MENNYVVHGSLGVCKVIGTEERMVGDESLKFVVIQATDPQNSKSSIPVKSFEIVTRDVVSVEKANSLLNEVPMNKCEYIKDYKKRTTDYLKLSTSNIIEDKINLILSLHLGFELSKQENKPVSLTDRALFDNHINEIAKEMSLALNENHETVLERFKGELNKRKLEA